MTARGRKRTAALVLLAAALAISACGRDTEPAGPDTLVVVNGDHVKRSELELVYMNLPEDERDNYTGTEGVKRLLEELITYKLMAQEAERRKLDRDPMVREQINIHRQQVLVNALLSRAVSQADVFEYFQRNFIRLRFIQAAFPEDAPDRDKKAALAKAEKIVGDFTPESDFAQLAREHSDADNAVEGGEMGYVVYDTIKNMVGIQAFEMVRALKKPGDITEPAEGKDGWYIFQLVEPPGKLDHRGLSLDLEEAIRSIKRDEVIRSLSNELNSRRDNVITYNEPAMRELLETVRENVERFATPEDGDAEGPGPDSGPEAMPGDDAGPEAPADPEGPEEGDGQE